MCTSRNLPNSHKIRKCPTIWNNFVIVTKKLKLNLNSLIKLYPFKDTKSTKYFNRYIL